MGKRELFSIGVMGLFMFSLAGTAKPDNRGTQGNNDPTPTPTVARTYEPVLASTLLADYKANEVRGDAKWKDHYVAVTGIVGDVKKDAFGGIYVTLGTGAQFEISTVHCQFPSNATGQAAALSKGQKVVIRGKVTGMILSSVMVDDSEVASP